MKTVTKRQLADLVARRTGAKRHVVKEILQAVLDGIIEELGKGSRLEFREFGVFEVKHRQSRFAQNPRTLERVSVPAKRIVKFKAGQAMKDSLQGVDRPTEVLPATEVQETTSVSSMPTDELASPPAP